MLVIAGGQHGGGRHDFHRVKPVPDRAFLPPGRLALGPFVKPPVVPPLTHDFIEPGEQGSHFPPADVLRDDTPPDPSGFIPV
jgi:hypothetical protein